jgi:hypothetical protein
MFKDVVLKLIEFSTGTVVSDELLITLKEEAAASAAELVGTK